MMATLAAIVATIVGTIFAIALLRRWAQRGRTPASLWWGLSLAQFALASAALLLGQLLGWSGAVFRIFYLFGAVTNVLWLALGTIAINVRRRGVTLTLGVTLLVVAGLCAWAASASEQPLLWWDTVALSAALGLLSLLPRADWIARGSAVVVVLFTLAAAVMVLGADLVAEIPTDGLPEGRALFGLPIRGLAVAGNVVGSVIVIVGALASSAHVVWKRPDRSADVLLTGVTVTDRSWFAATAEWLFAGRRNAPKAGNVVRGNLLIALGVLLAAGSALFAYLSELVSAVIGITLTDADTTGHAVGLAIGVIVMYAGFRRTLAPVERAPVERAPQ